MLGTGQIIDLSPPLNDLLLLLGIFNYDYSMYKTWNPLSAHLTTKCFIHKKNHRKPHGFAREMSVRRQTCVCTIAGPHSIIISTNHDQGIPNV